MKKIKVFLVLILTLALMLTAAGCGKTGVKDSQKDAAPGEKKLANPDITIMSWTYAAALDEKPSPRNDAIKWFESTYGGKVNDMKVNWYEYELKMLTLVSAGMGVDVVDVHENFLPKAIIRNLFQPVEPYMDLNDPVFDKFSMDYFKWKGKYYIVAATENIYRYKTIFNQTLFENNGVKTPWEYYQEGAWTFDNFKKTAKELTQDTDKDGITDQWGFSFWILNWFVLNNGSSFLEYTDDGSINNNLDLPNTLEGLQFYQDAVYTEKYIDMTGVFWTTFALGKVAMTCDSHAGIGAFCTGMKDKIGVAPLPVGPHGTTDESYATFGGIGIGTGCANPEGAGIFIEKLLKITKDWSTGKIKLENTPEPDPYLTEEQLEWCKKYDRETRPKFDMEAGIGDWNSKVGAYFAEISSGIPPATAAEKHKPVLQAEIDATLRDKIPVIEPFTAPAPEDFEAGILGIMTNSDVTPVKAEATKDAAEVIGGTTSLKIEAPGAGGFLLRTDETKIKLPSLHIYTVTFDYKIIKAPAAGGYFMVFAMPKANMKDWAKYYGWNQLPEVKDGDTGTYSCNVAIDKETTDNVILLFNSGGGSIVIDNLKIEEAKQ